MMLLHVQKKSFLFTTEAVEEQPSELFLKDRIEIMYIDESLELNTTYGNCDI